MNQALSGIVLHNFVKSLLLRRMVWLPGKMVKNVMPDHGVGLPLGLLVCMVVEASGEAIVA